MEQSIEHEAICDGYEYIWYNRKLRLIHSIDDDMYQMQSIINACVSRKQAKDWLKNDSTISIICALMHEIGKNQIQMENALSQMGPSVPGPTASGGEFSPSQMRPENEVILTTASGATVECMQSVINNRIDGVNPKVKGYYVHRLLVNHVAMWACPQYAIYVSFLLDNLFAQERESLKTTITEQQPRMVPARKEKNYKYMIWKEEPTDEALTDYIILHLVRRNNHVFRQVSKIQKDENKCWFYRENLPIAMTPNDDVKDLIRQLLPNTDYRINGTVVVVRKEHLETLHREITNYFDNFQQ